MGNSAIASKIAALDSLHFAERVQVLDQLVKTYGECIETLLLDHVAAQTQEEWEILRGIHPRCDLNELVNIQWEHISRSGGFEFELRAEADGLKVHCTHCPLAEMALHLNAAKWGYIYYCSRSPVAVKTFNANLNFKRTKTLMQGHTHCDHHYQLNQ